MYNIKTCRLMHLQQLTYRLFLITASVLFSHTGLWSRHIVGGDMRYQYLGETSNGNKQYRFVLQLYRDCLGGGAAFDNPALIAIYRGSWSSAEFVEKISVFNPLITNLPAQSNCSGTPPQLCIEQATYTFDKTLPVVAGQSYFIVYQRCCHVETISNIIEPGNVGSTVMVELNPEAMALNNSSPVLPPYPAVALCIHHPANVIQAATDADGDQLVYTFTAPYAGGGPLLSPPQVSSCEGSLPDPPCAPPYTPVPYVVPQYTPEQPMAGDPLIQLNPVSGVITGTPNVLGRFVVGVVVQEFRGATQLSTTIREISFNVFDENATAAQEPAAARLDFAVYPNPARDRISWPAALGLTEIQAFDLLGRRLDLRLVPGAPALDVSNWPVGWYRVLGITAAGQALSATLAVAR